MKQRPTWPACRCATLLPFILWIATAEAQQTGPPAFKPPWTWSVVYKADLLGATTPHTLAAMDNLSVQADADAAALFGWDDTALHAELLANHGSKLNRQVGTVQGISNIEVANSSSRLYATWVEHQFKAAGSRVLVGLYDLNSEFYATDASGMLIHPSFGIGIDFSQTGRNGPSIFPNLGFGARLRQPVGNGGYVQAAVIDGVPGDPDHPGRTTVRLRRSEGALVVCEAGWQETATRPNPGHWGIGLWQYTRASMEVDGDRPQRDQGVYAIAQKLLVGSGATRTTVFLRAGAADRSVNLVDIALDSGVLIEAPLGLQGPRALTAGVAIAQLGGSSGTSQRTRRTEVAYEIDARWQPRTSLALQPVLQWVRQPGGRSGSVALAGVRLDWTLEAK